MNTATSISIAERVTIILGEHSEQPFSMSSSLITDLGMDSLDFVELAQMIEQEFSIGPIPDDDLFKLDTVAQVIRYVESWVEKDEQVKAMGTVTGTGIRTGTGTVS